MYKADIRRASAAWPAPSLCPDRQLFELLDIVLKAADDDKEKTEAAQDIDQDGRTYGSSRDAEEKQRHAAQDQLQVNFLHTSKVSSLSGFFRYG
ncbi:hypothetical protein SDC9_87974 [bioreactor metagenome]|uniref:Uncharacterized protein n=1 Tax=bioreactor metagenome TaxID=1076179 RepID=A0A644ZKB7_9ZZZZ